MPRLKGRVIPPGDADDLVRLPELPASAEACSQCARIAAQKLTSTRFAPSTNEKPATGSSGDGLSSLEGKAPDLSHGVPRPRLSPRSAIAQRHSTVSGCESKAR